MKSSPSDSTERAAKPGFSRIQKAIESHHGQTTQNRRDFVKTVGSGICVLLSTSELIAAQNSLPSAYLQIGADGRVTVLTGKIEMGQGVMTSLAQMAAEELDVPMSSMRVRMGDTASCPYDEGTWGSLTTRNFGPPLRSAAAKARAILVQLASQQLGVATERLITRDGFVIDSANETVRVSYASLAGGKTVVTQLDQVPKQQDYLQFTVSGKPAVRIDAIEKVTGQAQYASDIRVPGMLYARILRPPAQGARLKSADTSAAEKIEGVRIVRAGALLAALHALPDMAEAALAQIKAEYDPAPTGPDQENIYQYLLGRAGTSPQTSGTGDVRRGEQLANAKVEQTYYTPYVAHAPIEPHAAVASVEGNKVTVWASTQTPFGLRGELASALGFSSANVRVIAPYVGGGFGGKIVNQQAIEAAQLSRAAGVPVSLAWTREEEFTYDSFQCPSIIKIRSGLDPNKKIPFWDYQVYYVGNRGAEIFYSIPNYRIQVYSNAPQARPFAGGAWRAPGNNANTFARESHIDALAVAAGMDPVEFRLLNLRDTRMRRALEKAAESFGWSSAKAPSGRGYGVACAVDAGAYVGMMAHVEVDSSTGQITVKRMLCAQEMGRVINPDGARMQIEGGMMMGLGYSLTEELHFQAGRILDLNFDSYSLPRFSWMPKLETVLVENNALSPQGVGEPPIITVGAVLANAVFDAVGVRLNRLPMTRERVLAAIQSKPPTLSAPERLGNEIRITWNGGPGIKLQKASSLTNPVWQDVLDTDGKSSVTLPLSDAAAYFRLIKL